MSMWTQPEIIQSEFAAVALVGSCGCACGGGAGGGAGQGGGVEPSQR